MFSGLFKSFFLGHLTTVSIVVGIVLILTGFVLIKKLMNFTFTDTVAHFLFLFFLDSIGKLSEIGLLIGIWLTGLLDWFVMAWNMFSVSQKSLTCNWKLEHFIMAQNFSIFSSITAKLFIQREHDL